MPDNEFDNLFRDKLINAEYEPSANLWAKIEGQLEPQKRKKVLPIYWMAAASVAVAFTAMLAFQKTEKIQLRADNVTAAVTAPFVQDVKEPLQEADVTYSPVSNKNVPATKVQLALNKVESTQVEINSENNDESLQPYSASTRLPIKQADPRPIDVMPVTQVEAPIVIAQALTSQSLEENVITETENLPERKSIRNVGDLVNYVVDKVDKRDKKLLRFNTDDDDNSSIVGINIGFLKLNKKNK
ncbi:MAG: hypothetical protein EOO90_05775 [Pedobacter sp.]|nr:MAG: hypothetical protein EOO90_05775 [Pedobacter sp.]